MITAADLPTDSRTNVVFDLDSDEAESVEVSRNADGTFYADFGNYDDELSAEAMVAELNAYGARLVGYEVR